jgi:V8-like Glu-specific endopeptidase
MKAALSRRSPLSKLARIAVSFVLCLPNLTFADFAPPVIYGDDNRFEPHYYEDFRFRILARSVAVQIKPTSLMDTTEVDPPVITDDIVPSAGSKKSREYYLYTEDLASRGICESERFAKQPSAGLCTGFLVGPNLLATAGHCIMNQDDCDKRVWAFDYKTSEKDENGEHIKLKDKNIYQCKRIIGRHQNRHFKDFAVIELDRPVVGRKPLKLNRSIRPIAVGEKVLVIGHPSGLPMKIADSAQVTDLSHNIFYATLDTYGGNSGSPVFNQRTGEVEGILVIGNEDYVLSPESLFLENKCVISNRMPGYVKQAEGVSYISHILPFVPEI